MLGKLSKYSIFDKYGILDLYPYQLWLVENSLAS